MKIEFDKMFTMSNVVINYLSYFTKKPFQGWNFQYFKRKSFGSDSEIECCVQALS